MEWKEYEEITKHIYESLGAQSGVEIIGYGNSCKVLGKSGVEHQIDVLTKHSDGIHSYRTAIECKYWDKTVNKDIVMKVSEITEDASLNKGVIVSKLGFTPDAVSFAQYKNIALIELRELTDEDWKGRIRDITITSEAHFAQVQGVELIIDPSVEANAHRGTFETRLFQIRKASGELIALPEIVKEFETEVHEQEVGFLFEKTYSYEKGAVIINKSNSTETPIRGLRFKGTHRVYSDDIEIKGSDHIWLIMKSVFENKTYTVTKDRIIVERKD